MRRSPAAAIGRAFPKVAGHGESSAGTQDAPPISFHNTAAGSVKGTFLNVGTRDANISFLSLISPNPLDQGLGEGELSAKRAVGRAVIPC